MVVFPLDQVPEMTRGRGVRLQRYLQKGLSDITTFKASEGLSWVDGAGRTQTLTMRELKDWQANRADAGRIAQGLPKNNKFRGAPAAAKKTDE
jgi:topoisomerase-4 subunit A